MENITKNQYTKEELKELFADDLKNHYLRREGKLATGMEDIPLYSKYNENKSIVEKDFDNNDDDNGISKFKIKLMSKIVICLIIFVGVVGYKYYPEELKQSEIINYIKKEYSKNHSKAEVLEKAEETGKYIYNKLQNIIPESAYNYVVSNYVEKIKPKIIDFNLKNFFEKEQVAIAVFNEEDFKINDDEAAPIEEAIAVNSELSLMGMDRDEILSKNISIIQPVQGTITSVYGTREEILEVVGYHTGIDIANAYNTEIKSATDGIVVKAEKMNYYYGNNIEIEKDGVIFKYAHLNQINVNEGDNITQGQVIGLMGATGQATGSHLHFEIRINERTVDPRMILEIK